MQNPGLPGEAARTAHSPGGMIVWVGPGSPADLAGIRAGDTLVAVDGHAIRDVLDFQFYAASERLALRVARDGAVLEVAVAGDQDIGLRFGDVTFDGIRRCKNHCPFCFVNQLPNGLRRSLYVKDDDYRYSVGYGSFVTLSNLTGEDWRRLAEQHLGPMRISVHATDLALRRRLLGKPDAPDVLEQIGRLRELGLQAHTQLVLCPGINDGLHLAQSVSDLGSMYPTVQSIAAVPVGITNRNRQPDLRSFTAGEARTIVEQVKLWQREYRRRLGIGLVYLADEFYLLAEEPVPSARQYDGYPQYENGVGLVRSLLEEWSCLRRRPRRLASPKKGPNAPSRSSLSAEQSIGVSSFARPIRLTIACGTRIAALFAEIADGIGALARADIAVVPVSNAFFGPAVNVSGLLTGGDVCSTLVGRDLGDLVVLPRAMLDAAGERCLDEATPHELESRLGRPVRFAATLSQLLRVIRHQSRLSG